MGKPAGLRADAGGLAGIRFTRRAIGFVEAGRCTSFTVEPLLAAAFAALGRYGQVALIADA